MGAESLVEQQQQKQNLKKVHTFSTEYTNFDSTESETVPIQSGAHWKTFSSTNNLDRDRKNVNNTDGGSDCSKIYISMVSSHTEVEESISEETSRFLSSSETLTANRGVLANRLIDKKNRFRLEKETSELLINGYESEICL